MVPRPPTSRGSHTLSQEAQAIFLPSEPHPQRKFLYIQTNLSATTEGILNNDIKKSGIEERTDLIKQILPAIDKHLPFHLDSLLCTFSTTPFQQAPRL